MSTTQPAKARQREYALQLDVDDPLKNFRKEFLIPTKLQLRSGMSLLPLEPAQYTYQ